MKQLLIFGLFFMSLTYTFGQDFAFVSALNRHGSTIEKENVDTRDVEISTAKGIHLDAHFVSSFDSKAYIAMDGSALTFFNNGTYNFGLFDTRCGLALHPKHPIKFGSEVEMVFGIGAALGFKMFSSEGSGGTFLDYGLTFHSTITVGEACQLLYINTATPGYNNFFDEISRVRHDFYFMYSIRDHLSIGIAPYIETFRYIEANKLEFDYTHRFKGLQIGFTSTGLFN